MAATLIQSGLNVVQTGTTIAVGSTQGWGTPTAGNVLIAVANSTFTITAPSGWTAGPSVVDDNAAYLWWKIAAGTETSLTLTVGGSAPSTLALFEYSGLLAAPTDVQNTSNAAGVSGTTTAAATITTTGPNGGDLVFAVAALARDVAGSTVPTGLTWSNGYVALNNHASDGTHGANDVSTWYSTLQQSAAGATSTSATWTNAWSARTGLIIGFKLAAAASQIPLLVMARSA